MKMKQGHKTEVLLCERVGACDIPAVMKALDSGLVSAVHFLFLKFFLTYETFCHLAYNNLIFFLK